MVLKLKKVVLITGASGGIGQAIAMRLSKEGFFTLLQYNTNKTAAEKCAESIRLENGEADIISFDVRDSQSVDATLNDWFGAHPDCQWDCLVNNAGIHNDNLAGMLSDDAFDSVLKTNTYGPFFLMRNAIRKMLRQRTGKIINISSLAGQTGNAGQINYAASKAALIAMTKTLAMEVGPRGIRVNAVAPGIIETEMIEGVEFFTKIKERIPLQRFGRAEEVAAAVSFLASEDSSYITGHTLSVNGGLFPT